MIIKWAINIETARHCAGILQIDGLTEGGGNQRSQITLNGCLVTGPWISYGASLRFNKTVQLEQSWAEQ